MSKNQDYLDKISEIIENIEKIHEELIIEQKMMKNLISLLNHYSSKNEKVVDLEDPVVKKAKELLIKLINSLQREYYKIDLLEPDESWKQFHEKFKQSLKYQIEGYQEILMVFTDGNITHIKVGSKKVEQALRIIDLEE